MTCSSLILVTPDFFWRLTVSLHSMNSYSKWNCVGVCQLTMYLGRTNLSWGNASLRLPCRQVCGTFSSLLIDVGSAIPREVVLGCKRKKTEQGSKQHGFSLLQFLPPCFCPCPVHALTSLDWWTAIDRDIEDRDIVSCAARIGAETTPDQRQAQASFLETYVWGVSLQMLEVISTARRDACETLKLTY